MTDVTASGVPGEITTTDGVPLKTSLARATRRQRLQALVLVLPLLLFLLVAFVLPIGEMLFRSVYSPIGSNVLPNFSKVIQEWDGEDLPPESTFEVFVKDMRAARENNEIGKTVGNLATRINYEIPGSRGLFTRSARKLKNITEGPYKEALIGLDKRWESQHIWRTLQRVSHDYTLSFYLAALDRKYDENNEIVRADPLYRIYVPIMLKTLWLSAVLDLAAGANHGLDCHAADRGYCERHTGVHPDHSRRWPHPDGL